MNREDWTEITFDKKYIKGTVKKTKNNKLLINGQVKTLEKNKMVTYWAADSAQTLESFSGSHLPFPNKQMAFSNKIIKIKR